SECPQVRSAASKIANCAATIARKSSARRARITPARERRRAPSRPPRPPPGSSRDRAGATGPRRTPERRLPRNRHRVMNQRLDAAPLEMRLQRVALRAEDREQVVDVSRVVLARDGDGRPRQTPAVLGGERAPLGGPPRQPRQPRPED